MTPALGLEAAKLFTESKKTLNDTIVFLKS